MALRTILDSNITTVIVALLLYVFGSSAIKGICNYSDYRHSLFDDHCSAFYKVFVQSWYEIFRPKNSIYNCCFMTQL